MAGALRLENVLKRAEELEAMQMATAALDTLYETVASKRTRAMPLDQLEPVFAKFLALACELRRGKLIKDGLHQFKKLAIAAAGDEGVVALERAVSQLLTTSSDAVHRAQEEAAQTEAAQQQQRAEVDDLEEESPQNLMLALVTSEEAKDRTDREVVTPWLKFLWENFRSVLDVLRNNSKLETAYARVASQAFQFCAEHNRKTEFRRLCELLRTHLQYAATQSRTYHADLAAARVAAVEQLAQQQGLSTAAASKEVTPQQVAMHMPPNAPPYPIDLSDADTLQRFLDTRFEQLERAVALELWQETYRSIEDVHTLLTATRRAIPVQSMATYYETLARVFAVSQNHLFHAATWFRYFAMLASRRAPETELRRIASFCVLSLLCVAPSNESAPAPVQGRTRRWMNLINLTRVPTREVLVEVALACNVLNYASPELRELFNLFQPEKFNALTLKHEITRLAPYLEMNRKEFASYFTPMLEVAATSVFGALARSYTAVSLQYVLGLVAFPAPFEVNPKSLERLLVRHSTSLGSYEIRIDHSLGVVRFVDSLSYPLDGTAGALIRNELYALARALARVTAPQDEESHKAGGSGSRLLSVTEARATLIAEKRDYHERIERENERELSAKRAKSAAEEEEQRERVRRADELRMRQEAQQAEEEARAQREQLRREMAAIELEEKRKLAISINSKGHIHVDLNKLEETTRAQLQKMQIEQVEQETKSLDARMAAVARRYDHLERALRQEEAKLWREEAANQRNHDKEAYDKRVEALVQGSRRRFEEDQKFAERLARARGAFHDFHTRILDEHERAVAEKQSHNAELLAKAKEERLAQIAEERRRAAEQREREQQRREEERKRQEEESAERQRRAEKQAALDKERAERLEASRLHAQKIKEEIQAKRSSPAPTPAPASTPSPTKPSPFGAAKPSPFGAAKPSPFGAAKPSPFGAARPASSPASRPGDAPRGSPFGAARPVDKPADASKPADAKPGKFVPSFKRNQQ